MKEQPRHPLEAARNPRFEAGRAITEEVNATTYNNYYEFGMSKSIVGPAQALKVEPWTIRIDGMVALAMATASATHVFEEAAAPAIYVF